MGNKLAGYAPGDKVKVRVRGCATRTGIIKNIFIYAKRVDYQVNVLVRGRWKLGVYNEADILSLFEHDFGFNLLAANN